MYGRFLCPARCTISTQKTPFIGFSPVKGGTDHFKGAFIFICLSTTRFLVLYNFGQIGDIAAQVADMNQQRQTGIFDIFIFVHNHHRIKERINVFF